MTFTNQRLSEYVYNTNQLYGWCMAIGITKEQTVIMLLYQVHGLFRILECYSAS